MDSEKSNDSGSNKIEESPPEKILSSGIQLRASARVSKKLRLDQEQALAQAPSPEKTTDPSPTNGIPPEEKRRRRAPVLWSTDDKAAFFEALNEHGKNFDAIEKYMTSRAKKRGDCVGKNRERARYFYYRTWHKLSRYVQFPPSVKKVTQELYTLINFGELRKKIGHVTEKNSQKLSELIYSGRTQVRVRGKTYRIKTPVCRALRHLNNIREDCEEVRLPAKIEVFLSPRSTRDSIPARSSGHNPRARAVLSLDTDLNSIISFLYARWSSSDDKGELRVGPKSDAVITQTQFKCGQAVNSGTVSLLAHEQRCGGDSAEVQALLDQLHTGKAKGTLKKEKEGALGTEDISSTEFIDPLIADQPTTSSIPLENSSSADIKEDKEVVDEKKEFITRAREGWTLNSSQTKIGQLYMMLGSKGIIELEYWWPSNDEQNELTKELQKLVSLARLYHYKPKVECHCGHKCKAVVKPGASDSGKSLKRPASSGSPTGQKSQFNVDLSSVSSHRIDVTRSMDDTVGLASSVAGPEVNPHLVSTGAFKHPLLPAPMKQANSSSTIDTLKQLQTFRPKYCNRRGRSRSRSVVVQRMLPLLPKSSQNQPMMVALISPTAAASQLPNTGEIKDEIVGLVEPATLSSCSTPGLDEKPLLEITKEEDVSLALQSNSSENDGVSTNTFRGILGGGTDGELSDTPPTSPSRILKEGEGQWLNSEVSDFSLSSFLGHLENPLKSNGANTTDDIHITSDVESHFQSLMTESSLDYTAKFADLAEKIAGAADPHIAKEERNPGMNSVKN